MTTATATANEKRTEQPVTSEEPTSAIDRATAKAAEWAAEENRIKAENETQSWGLLIKLLMIDGELNAYDTRELAQSILDLKLPAEKVKLYKAAIAKVRRLEQLHDGCQAALDEMIKLRNDRVVLEKLTKKQLEEAWKRQLKAGNRHCECCGALGELQQMKKRSPMLFAGDDSTPPRLHRLDSKQ